MANPTKKTLVCSDSLSSILAITHYSHKSLGQQMKKCFSWILSQILDQIETIRDSEKEKGAGDIFFYHVKSHAGISPNVQVDAMADCAAKSAEVTVLDPTVEISLTAVCCTLRHGGSRIHRLLHKYIKNVASKYIIKHLMIQEEHKRYWAPWAYNPKTQLPLPSHHPPRK